MSEEYEVLDAGGYTSTVYLLPGDPPRVCKSFKKEYIGTHFPTEREAYERFSNHNPPSSILKYYGIHRTILAGLVLELAENKNLHKYRWDGRYYYKWPEPEVGLFYRWALQAVEALEFAHSLGVYNSDIHTVNFFLDGDLNLKVGDWAGASIDGSKSYSAYRWKSRLFQADGTDVVARSGITVATETFALGTALYSMITCQEPWPELRDPEDRGEIKERVQDKLFPDTGALPVLGSVIAKCWKVEFASMTEVRRAIEIEKTEHTLQ